MTAPGNSGQSADASARPINILIYPQNGAGVRIVALGLHKAAFFNVVQALHDGHATPALASQLQRELDTSTPPTPR